MKVLVVDDSAVYRKFVKEALAEVDSIQVVGSASNGRIALDLMKNLNPDLVLLDMEMPEMDGLTTLKEIRRENLRQRVICFAAPTANGAGRVIEALSQGASDFISKPSGESSDPSQIKKAILEQLKEKILQFADRKTFETKPSNVIKDIDFKKRPFPIKDLVTFRPELVVIGSSTGGPPALENILKGLAGVQCPILIGQHMPAGFTTSLAKRLEKVSGLPCAEGRDKEDIVKSRIYVAPGNYHMEVCESGGKKKISLHQKPPRNYVRPAVDYLFESAARVAGRRCLAIVLTGMGEDGKQGCRAIKEAGGGVLIQSKESCVVFGMPGAVFGEGTYDQISNLNGIHEQLLKMAS